MKEAISNLIDRLASKELTFGCLVKDYPTGKTMRYAGKHFDDVKMKDFYAYYSLWDGEQELFRERNDDFTYPENRVLGHPIHLHDVLEKMENWYWKNDFANGAGWEWYRERITRLWEPCGFTKSLQEIYAEAEWEGEQQPNGQPKHVVGSRIVLVPKQPAIRKLFQLLLQLNLAE